MEELIAKFNQNTFQLNESKCKELRISFAKSAADFASIVINGKTIEVMSTVKLLGLNISSDLRWNGHVAEISKKVASRLYFLKQLKRANIPTKDLLIFYRNFLKCKLRAFSVEGTKNSEIEKHQSEINNSKQTRMRKDGEDCHGF